MASIAWIGLGNMGGPMAANLVRSGHSVTGYDMSSAAIEQAAKTGVVIAETIQDAVAGADFVFTMLPNGQIVADVYTQPGGVFDSAKPSAVMVDSSTIDIASSKALHAQAQSRKLTFLDAPVSGGTVGAEAATLTFMVGGSAEVLEVVRPIIDAMSKNIFYCGEASMGQAAKIANNMILFITLAATAEGAVLADRLGLDRQVFWDLASVSSADSWALRTWYPISGPVPNSAANRDFEPTFTVELAHKDVNLALQAGEDSGTPLELAEHVSDLFQRLISEGLGKKDCSILSKLVDGSLNKTD
jgi:3-hydroxyisobutyrate dehydrogenase